MRFRYTPDNLTPEHIDHALRAARDAGELMIAHAAVTAGASLEAVGNHPYGPIAGLAAHYPRSRGPWYPGGAQQLREDARRIVADWLNARADAAGPSLFVRACFDVYEETK